MSDHRHHTWHWEQISSVKVKRVAVSQGSLQRLLTLTVWRQCPAQVSSTRWEVRARAGKVGSLPYFDPNSTSLLWSITLMTHTLPFPQSRTHTQTWTESVWPHLIYCPGYYSHGSRCGQHHFRFNQTNHPFSGIQTLWKNLWNVLNAGLALTEKPTRRVCFSPANEKCRVTFWKCCWNLHNHLMIVNKMHTKLLKWNTNFKEDFIQNPQRACLTIKIVICLQACRQILELTQGGGNSSVHRLSWPG